MPWNENTVRSRDFDADITLGPDATIGDKVHALRLYRKVTMAGLAKAANLSERAIRYIENNERQPGIDVLKRIAEVLEVGTDFFMSDELFAQAKNREKTLELAQISYGPRGKTQAERIYNQTQALFAGGQLSEEDREAFRDLMMDLFFETKEEAKKYASKRAES